MKAPADDGAFLRGEPPKRHSPIIDYDPPGQHCACADGQEVSLK